MTENKRETGARIPKEDHRPTEIDQRAAENKRPKEGGGLSQSPDETNDRTRQSDHADTMETSQQATENEEGEVNPDREAGRQATDDWGRYNQGRERKMWEQTIDDMSEENTDAGSEIGSRADR